MERDITRKKKKQETSESLALRSWVDLLRLVADQVVKPILSHEGTLKEKKTGNGP